ncbi:hypothetical protein Hanom_Chr11g01045291 [Helianthus anomalus]
MTPKYIIITPANRRSGRGHRDLRVHVSTQNPNPDVLIRINQIANHPSRPLKLVIAAKIIAYRLHFQSKTRNYSVSDYYFVGGVGFMTS